MGTINWSHIDTVLLDLDGTLLDLHFDNHFWLEHLPVRYADHHQMTVDEARTILRAHMQTIEGTLPWYCLDYWARWLSMDVMALKHEIAHLIAVKPLVTEFLAATRARHKRIILVTNGHRLGLQLKLARTGLDMQFDRLVSAHDFGAPKEQRAFWEQLHALEPYDPARTLLVDDNLHVARQARAYGIAHIIVPRQPDSRRPPRDIQEFLGLTSFAELI
jgi:5'-nucleotidase